MSTVIIVNSEGMGHGAHNLGMRLLQTMLGKAGMIHDLEAIVFYNRGVRVLVEGSALLPALAAVEESGVDLIACGTCVDDFGIRDQVRVGRVGGMDDILAELDKADKVITL